MPQTRPMPGEVYRHFKDRLYQIVAVATHSETREAYVVYQALYGDFAVYVRPYDMFISEVDRLKYPNVAQKYRFELVDKRDSYNIGKTAGHEDERIVGECIQSEESWTEIDSVGECAAADECPADDIESELSGVNPRFIEFLDADEYERKYEIFCLMEDELDDHLINQMSASIDEVVADGRLDERIEQLRIALRTKARYELHRR